jgi:hypothetical protein
MKETVGYQDYQENHKNNNANFHHCLCHHFVFYKLMQLFKKKKNKLKHQLIMDELKSYFINKLFIFKKLIRKIIQIENDKIIY